MLLVSRNLPAIETKVQVHPVSRKRSCKTSLSRIHACRSYIVVERKRQRVGPTISQHVRQRDSSLFRVGSNEDNAAITRALILSAVRLSMSARRAGCGRKIHSFQ